MKDILIDPDVARDMTWHSWIAERSEGIAEFWIDFDEATGILSYGLEKREE